MFNAIMEGVKVFLFTIWSVGLAFVKGLYQLSGIPTTQYGLVKYIAENNVLLFNNEAFTKIIMFVTPLIVSHLIVYICDCFRIRGFKEKEVLSIILYLVILYIFSMWQFWLIIGIIVFSIVIVTILSNVKMKRIPD